MAEGRTGPEVDADGVLFRLPDPHRRLRGVRLAQEVGIAGDRLEFTHRRGTWSLRLERPAVDRLEYLFDVQAPGGERSTLVDPGNPRRAPGAFGEKSVVEFPGYRPPAWLSADAAGSEPGTETAVAVRSRALGSTVRATVWSPAGLSEQTPAAMVVVHDGPEFAALGGFLGWASATAQREDTAPFRVALLAPGDRNRWYAVSPAYARALTGEVRPALAAQWPTTAWVGAGASLGALAMLHAHRHAPGTFDALFLQSGSFFTPAFDAHERRFERYGPVTRFVTELTQAVADPAPVPVAMTCGGPEENLANNEAMRDALVRLDYPVRFTTTRDVHNFTAWRDALDPHLTRLVQEATDAA